MLLKKQTVWLLTMLSLVIVLSVYYVITPPKNSNDMATTVQNEDKQEEKNTSESRSKAEGKTKATSSEITISNENESFENARLEINDQRNKQLEEYSKVMANTELTAEERKEANDAMEEINEASNLETMLETFIVGMEDYQAALVHVDNGKVKVTVQAKDLSKTAANQIIRLVNQEVPSVGDVAVVLQPTE
ncbi:MULTISPECIES: SpoIIIAH-like family protein [Bacillus]|uniref:SpoIIIAH-like family protein n=1 Tax=Bacillus TaxID=1386 RepID=UPI00031002CE|nr:MULTISPECIES: SpoIIIAH-like family protein [Bacillus]